MFNWIKAYYTEKAEDIIRDMAITTLTKIEVKPGLCQYNFRCHLNAVHDAIEHKQNKIAMCLYIDGNQPIIHFINVDKKGIFTDNTLGHWSSRLDYYWIKYIEKEDFFDITSIFRAYNRELETKLPFIVKLLGETQF